jgi:molecular chaperone HtpG
MREDYKTFYHELYPMQFEEPLFHTVWDYPFVSYWYFVFSKLSGDLQIQKIKFSCTKTKYVTDNVEGIVPEF